MNTAPQEHALSKYRQRLGQLAGMKGRRNASLLGLATLAVMAGRGDDQIESEVIAAGGHPALNTAEVRHALATARRDTAPLGDRPDTSRRWTPPKPKPRALGTGAASFVRRMIGIGAGATFETLAASSPVPIPAEPSGQTCLFLKNLYRADEHLFCGERFSTGTPGADIDACGEWVRLIGGGKLDAPAALVSNPLTGRPGLTKEGRASFRCAACVASYRFALIEFDALPLADQCAFWQGVISSGVLPVRSLTFSGGKSIHGLVEVGAENADAWGLALDTLLSAVASPAAPKEHHADRACRNPDRLSRLPGAATWDREKNRVRSQPLLWLSGGN